VTITFIILGYFAAAGLFIRLVQFAHARDEAMRRITAEWIEGSAGATP
jgi:hypothetical protein